LARAFLFLGQQWASGSLPVSTAITVTGCPGRVRKVTVNDHELTGLEAVQYFDFPRSAAADGHLAALGDRGFGGSIHNQHVVVAPGRESAPPRESPKLSRGFFSNSTCISRPGFSRRSGLGRIALTTIARVTGSIRLLMLATVPSNFRPAKAGDRPLWATRFSGSPGESTAP
jgi:hypothetical protein